MLSLVQLLIPIHNAGENITAIYIKSINIADPLQNSCVIQI